MKRCQETADMHVNQYCSLCDDGTALLVQGCLRLKQTQQVSLTVLLYPIFTNICTNYIQHMQRDIQALHSNYIL